MADFNLPFIVSTSIAIVVVILTYVDMRRRLKQEQEFSKSMAELINTLREELQLFRKQSSVNLDLELLKILTEREELQWKRIMELGKATGYFKHSNEK